MEQKAETVKTPWLRIILTVLALLASAALCIAVAAGFLKTLATGSGAPSKSVQGTALKAEVGKRFDMYINNRLSGALDGVLAIRKTYWLSDGDISAPKPDPAAYGVCSSPAELMPVLEQAAELLEGQSMYFTADTRILEGSQIRYYLDETILAITWKQDRAGSVYTFCEVKIAHPSQLRRFLSGGAYGSEIRQTTTEMAQSVNAVLASSGDFYGFRRAGVVCHDGIVYRADRLHEVDTCFIDDQGEMILSKAGSFRSREEAQAFVNEHNIRFSLAFGPILVDGGQRPSVDEYPLGDVEAYATRAVLGQRDKLHYVIAVCNLEGKYQFLPLMSMFQNNITDIGCDRVYALDGGQTAVIALNGELVNSVHFGTQRDITDIFYFATAIPDGEK